MASRVSYSAGMEDRLTCGQVTYSRLACAAITNGCPSFLIFETARNVDIDHLDREIPEDRRVDDLLRMNGWRISYGRWVCGLHERAAATPPTSFTCPRCDRTSYNPNDIREGYCGACHNWTGQPSR